MKKSCKIVGYRIKILITLYLCDIYQNTCDLTHNIKIAKIRYNYGIWTPKFPLYQLPL